MPHARKQAARPPNVDVPRDANRLERRSYSGGPPAARALSARS